MKGLDRRYWTTSTQPRVSEPPVFVISVTIYTDMADSVALGELFNQQRPGRRADKTYGKKKSAMGQSRAMHFDLFGGGHENMVLEKMVLDKMTELTLEDGKTDTVAKTVVADQVTAPEKKNKTELNPRFRGRRKVHASKKIVVSPHNNRNQFNTDPRLSGHLETYA